MYYSVNAGLTYRVYKSFIRETIIALAESRRIIAHFGKVLRDSLTDEAVTVLN